MSGKSKKFYKEDVCRIIGVSGIRRGVGTTHFCVLAANYLSGFMGKKTAVLEWNGHGDFSRIERVCRGKEGTSRDFSVLDVTYYKKAEPDCLRECMESGFQYVLVDFGTISEEDRNEVFPCSKRILIGSFTEWQEEEFLQCLRNGKREKESWIYAVVFGSGEARREVRKRLKVPVLRIPYAEDAFTVTPVLLGFFQNFFED